MHTAGKISTCPDWKITCPVGHVTTKFYVPWDKIYMPRACGHPLMSSPAVVVSIVPADGLAHNGAKPSAGTLMTMFTLLVLKSEYTIILNLKKIQQSLFTLFLLKAILWLGKLSHLQQQIKHAINDIKHNMNFIPNVHPDGLAHNGNKQSVGTVLSTKFKYFFSKVSWIINDFYFSFVDLLHWRFFHYIL